MVRIVADRVQIDGVIRADGQQVNQGGAGGSVWVTTGAIAGTGSIEANGARTCCSGDGQGGGGAIAIDYTSVEPGTTLLDNLSATTGTYGRNGGAGSIYLHGPDAVYGDVIFDNAGSSGITELPSLGSGVAQAGTAGAVLVTDRPSAFPAYFVGHWVHVETADRVLKGTWRVAAVDGSSLTLAPNGSETIALDEGDEWNGVYRFDSVTLGSGVTLQSVDPVEEVVGASVGADALATRAAPVWDPEAVTLSIGAVPGLLPRRGGARSATRRRRHRRGAARRRRPLPLRDLVGARAPSSTGPASRGSGSPWWPWTATARSGRRRGCACRRCRRATGTGASTCAAAAASWT